MASSKPIAFVIIPFSDDFDGVFSKLIAPALTGYDVIRADSRLDQQNILQKIVRGIADSDLVIADVTGTNPNVMYELGAAHALGKPTVMISQNIGSLPFDIRSYQVQAYSTHFAAADELVTRLRDIGEQHAAGLLSFGNPFTDFLSRREFLTSTPAQPTLAGATDDYGYMDCGADMEQYGAQVLAQFDRLRVLTAGLTSQMQTRAPALRAARESTSQGSAVRAKQLTNELAAVMVSYAREVRKDVLPLFHEGWAKLGFAMSWMASQKPHDATAEQIADFCSQGRELRSVLSAMAGNISEVRDVVSAARGMTALLNEAVDEMEQAFNATISEIMVASALLAAAHGRMGCTDDSF